MAFVKKVPGILQLFMNKKDVWIIVQKFWKLSYIYCHRNIPVVKNILHAKKS